MGKNEDWELTDGKNWYNEIQEDEIQEDEIQEDEIQEDGDGDEL